MGSRGSLRTPQRRTAVYRVMRTLRANAGEIPIALQWAADLTAYVNKNYPLSVQFGAEFGSNNIQWHWEIDSLDRLQQLNLKLLKDREYWAFMQKAKGLFVEGTMKDTILSIAD
jgi:hypothetical protein